ncbi:MAG: L-seryl-tRNA(Sec) selenium transferase [Solirubrobacterales bacterium]|nr:MAG: L-seryl-tRNA(Sec) selenium transferase [Solirubrobacterales bacterium]
MGAGPPAAQLSARLRALPAVHELAAALDGPRAPAVAAARAVLDQRRAELTAGAQGDEDLAERARAILNGAGRPSLRRVLNATGVILHTNLGRAPLAPAARAAVARAAEGYSNLELDLQTGARGSRHDHVERLLRELTGAEAAIVVNNCAAAVLLAAAALAGPERSIAVSRGQLVEIGGSFRIPDVIAQSGSRLVEVGTTNRTRLADYERAVGAGVDAILCVHQSNFRTVGFVEEVEIEALCLLSAPVIDDLGSGALGEIGDEPTIGRSVKAGAALICCSADKLLGGPQAGVIVGTAGAVAAARAHPLGRALRIDKLSLAALEATLELHRSGRDRDVPALEMLTADEQTLQRRAETIAAAVGPAAAIVRATAKAGGGALPLLELDGPVVAVTGGDDLLARLRAHDPPVIARISEGRVLLDPRTLSDEDATEVANALAVALDG